MITLELSQATAPLASYVQNVRKEPTVLTDSGKPIVAAFVFLENADWETIRLSNHLQFLAIILKNQRHDLKQKAGFLVKRCAMNYWG